GPGEECRGRIPQDAFHLGEGWPARPSPSRQAPGELCGARPPARAIRRGPPDGSARPGDPPEAGRETREVESLRSESDPEGRSSRRSGAVRRSPADAPDPQAEPPGTGPGAAPACRPDRGRPAACPRTIPPI